jgi:hypothetical protein
MRPGVGVAAGVGVGVGVDLGTGKTAWASVVVDGVLELPPPAQPLSATMLA